MIRKIFSIRFSTSLILNLIFFLLCSVTLSGCFTGVEGTKKISLTRKEKKNLRETPEDQFLASLTPTPLNRWERKRPFVAADNRVLLIFDPEGQPLSPDSAALKGQILHFEGVEPRKMPDGSKIAVLTFSYGNKIYRYATGKDFTEAPTTILSDQIPMLIDLQMVDDVRTLLRGQKLWTRSPLWADKEGTRIAGRKYVPVTVNDVTPGSLEFPLKVEFTDERGQTAWMMMNFGLRGNESRSFPKIFMLSSLRDRYPHINDQKWNLICSGKVMVGMTKAECKLALGNPSDADAGRDYTQTIDVWKYPDGSVLWFEDGILTRLRN